MSCPAHAELEPSRPCVGLSSSRSATVASAAATAEAVTVSGAAVAVTFWTGTELITGAAAVATAGDGTGTGRAWADCAAEAVIRHFSVPIRMIVPELEVEVWGVESEPTQPGDAS